MQRKVCLQRHHLVFLFTIMSVTTDVSKNSRYVKYSTYVLNVVSETTAVQVYNKTTAYREII